MFVTLEVMDSHRPYVYKFYLFYDVEKWRIFFCYLGFLGHNLGCMPWYPL